MKNLVLICLLLAGTSVYAQNTTVVEAIPSSTTEMGAGTETRTLRGGAQVRVKFLTEITTEDKASRVGDRPRLEVAEDVTVDGVTVIPRGTPVTGELTAVRNKGMWGKSGKIEGRIINMSLNGRTVRMSGSFDDKGVTGTAGVVAAVALVPVVGFFVTGTSARILSGGVVSAYIDEDVSFAVRRTPPPPPSTNDGGKPSGDLSQAKSKCADLGFKPGTPSFGECVLKVSE
jgi:hypothetical protein